MSYLGVLDEPLLKLETGEGGYERALVAASPRLGGGHLLGALELVHKDGPWVNPDDYRKLNAALRWSRGDATSGFTVTGLYYGADWNSTDQIPERAVDDGSVPRFGAIDPSDGGRARRASLSAEWQAARGDRLTRVSAFALRNELNLWSNFTYRLDDPENGDQFEQEDRRSVLGLDASHQWSSRWGGRTADTRIGARRPLRRHRQRGPLRDARARAAGDHARGQRRRGEPLRLRREHVRLDVAPSLHARAARRLLLLRRRPRTCPSTPARGGPAC